MKHYMHLNEAPFQNIWDGNKTIELRLLDSKRKTINVGDEIEFSKLPNGYKLIIVRVIALHTFPSFRELFEVLPLEKCGYDQDSIKIAHWTDMNTYYSGDEQLKYGVVGIEFKVEEKCSKKN